jgi:hypothetical protein
MIIYRYDLKADVTQEITVPGAALIKAFRDRGIGL